MLVNNFKKVGTLSCPNLFLLHNVSLAQELIGIVPLLFQVQPLN